MVEFLLTKEYQVKEPKFDFPANAGIDGFIPTNTAEFREKFTEKNPKVLYQISDVESWYDIETGEIHIAPHHDVLIPSGLYIKIPEDSALINFNKSGIATKKKLIAGACVIDFSYQGIVHYHVINTSNEYQVVKCDEKILQMVEVKIGNGATVTKGIDQTEFFTEQSSRGDKGFGNGTGLL